ncbi:MAG: hypothetical protein LH610_08570 [Sphingomonas bacterium]|nr:hypothetical protein [Sphingomonas bacterium]
MTRTHAVIAAAPTVPAHPMLAEPMLTAVTQPVTMTHAPSNHGRTAASLALAIIG